VGFCESQLLDSKDEARFRVSVRAEKEEEAGI
jgi:hypothetical protein